MRELITMSAHEPTNDVKQALFRSMLRVRRVEERIASLYGEQEMRCPTHFSIGQEAVAAGVCALLQPTDSVISAHRSHAHYLCSGGNLNRMLAELYGKATGCAGGKGGSMHLIDLDVNFLGCVPIVGSTIGIGVGSAMPADIEGDISDRSVSFVFFGDGATETGIFHESLNYAAMCKLPVIFVCENNLYSVMTALEERQPTGRTIAGMAAGHGIETYHGDGQDCSTVYSSAAPLIEHARSGNGPVLLEYTTYRWLEHCGPREDLHFGFRPAGEFEEWLKKCPVEGAKRKYLGEEVLTEPQVGQWEQEISLEIDEAIAFAQSSPFPDRSELLEGIYAS